MAMPTELKSIRGAQELYNWFGFWPSFHDAEVVTLHLNRKGPSYMAVHTWEMTERVDSKGYYELAKHVVVQFVLEELLTLSLEGFSGQNVIFGLSLDPCYGVSGSIEAASLSINIAPGAPS